MVYTRDCTTTIISELVGGWVGVHILGLVGRPDMVKGASSTRGGFDWYTRILGVVAKPF